MKSLAKTLMVTWIALLTVSPLSAQTVVQTQRSGDQPLYKITINVVEKTAKAINYRHRSGATKIDFRGTPLLPAARGEAKVESKQGYIEIEVEFDELQSATRYGPEFLTYVMWAITPEGRAQNLGEVILNGTESKLNVTTELQAFGLIVTAEPYFAVTQPSDAVVMENFVRADTVGKVDEIEAKYELLKRGQYTANVPPAELKAIPLDKDTPLDLYEARNAVRIARWAGADKDASESFAKAEKMLAQAEDYKRRNAGKPISTAAREAVQTAEDARLIALKRQEEQRLAMERQASSDREAQAKAAADRARLESEEQARQRARAEEAGRLETERRARAEAERAATEAQAKLAAERASRERASLEADARAAAERAAREKAAVEAEADSARMRAERAEQEKRELRAKLIQQLNLILETRDSARGLIVNMSDVLFDTARHDLKPGAREKVARISGILLAHPGLSMEIEGHTDSVGSDEYNLSLSERRANTVRDLLVKQGVPATTIKARGMGETSPVASNDNAAGRQQNRRVELIVSGDVIGTSISANIQ